MVCSMADRSLHAAPPRSLAAVRGSHCEEGDGAGGEGMEVKEGAWPWG